MVVSRNKAPNPIGSIEVVRWLDSIDRSNVERVEVPIIELFEINGEEFAFILDADYATAFGVDFDEDEIDFSVCCYSVKTGIVASGQHWGDKSFIYDLVKRTWEKTGYRDLTVLASRVEGAIPVRGTVKPLPEVQP